MHKAFAIAKAKVTTKYRSFLGEPEPNADIGHEVSKAGLGLILCAGALIGLSGFIFFIGGIIKSDGITGFVKGWILAFTGM